MLRFALMLRFACLIGLATGALAQGSQAQVHLAPVDPERFPAAWYPPENDWTRMPAPVLGLPYTGTMVQTSQMPASAGRPASQARHSTMRYRDRMGRVRTEESDVWSQSGTPRREIEVVDPVSHCTFRWTEPSAELGTGTATVQCLSRRVQYGPSTYAWLADAVRTGRISPTPKDGSVELLGEKVFSGVKATGVRYRKSEGAPATDFWWSATLQELVALGPETPIFGFPNFELTEVKMGEPDAKLFYPPPGYRIVKSGN
jgi:hypothetical protein